METTTATGTETAERYVKGPPAPEPVAPNLVKAFHMTAERLGPEAAIRQGDRSISWAELRKKAAALAGGFNSLGVGRGDTVALMTTNRLEFIPTDLGAVTCGGVPFSIYATSSPEQIQHVCADSGARVAVVEKQFLDRFLEAKKSLPELEHVITLDGEGGTMTFEELEAVDPDFDDSAGEQVESRDLLTLIYTSGTTGPPKGVQITHYGVMHLTGAIDDFMDLPPRGGKVISWLPTAHIAERAAHYYLPITKGVEVTVCPDPKQIIEVLPQVRPSMFFAVPRIWEKVKAGIEAKLEGESGVKKNLAQWAIGTGISKIQAEQRGESPSALISAQHAVADRLVLAKLRQSLGLDEARGVFVGAAPTPVEVLEFFHGIGIPIGELWGMSENTGAVTMNPPGKEKLGTVGPPLPGWEVKLAEDGEILVKGEANMLGYRNQPEKTAETIDSDGWLRTGDIGELDEDGYLKIVDRKKELIINAAGKNMSPANIEAQIKSSSPLIGQCVAIGDGRPYNVALIVLDPEAAPAWAEGQEIGDRSLAALAENPKVEAAVQQGVDQANANLSRVEQIKKFKILPNDWEPGGDELTPTMKLKRKPINEKYGSEIEALYAG